MRTHLLILSALLIFFIPQPAKAEDELPYFEEVPCETFDLPGLVDLNAVDQNVECGYLVVPEDRSDPESSPIKLGVLVLKSTGFNPGIPLVMTQGGPGGSGIELFGSFLNYARSTGDLLRSDRDLIILEQRGTQYSLPFLACTESLEADLEHLEEDLPIEEETRLQEEAYRECRGRFEQEGINLSAYNSFENADDVADLAEALGYEKINFYGVSYGSQLGQHLMKRHPDLLEAVVLDGVVALDINPNQKIPWAISRSLRALFAACQKDPDCDRYYPELEKIYFETIEALNENPGILTMTDPDTGVEYRSIFDGDDLSYLTTQLLYASEAIPLLPKLIYDANNREFNIARKILPVLVFDRSFADGMYMAVMCAEDFDFETLEMDSSGAYPSVLEEQQIGNDLVLDICRDFGVVELGAQADQAVKSSIPTLLLSGYFDPVTPPVYADQVASTLEHAYSYTFPAYGHGALLTGDCAPRITRDFLKNPSDEPDTSCISETGQLTFYSPGNTLMSPGATALTELLDSELRTILAGGDTMRSVWRIFIPLLLPVQLLAVLITFPVIWALSWIIKRIRKQPGEQRLLARLAPWLAALCGAVAFLFACLLLFQISVQLMGAGEMQSLVGVSRSFIWVYTLPWIIALLAIVMVVLSGVSWINKYWSPARRIYFSFTTLAALLFVFTTAAAGMFSVIFS